MRPFLLSFILLIVLPAISQDKTYLVRAGKFYDSEKNVFLTNQDVIVRGKKIVKVGPNLAKPEGAEIISIPQGTISPGLIDAHTHILYIQKIPEPLEADVFMHSDIERSLRAVKFARTFLEAGFTTIRDLGNSGMFLDLNVKRAIDNGWVTGPRMIVSGPILSPEDGQFFNLSSQNRFVIEREYRIIKNVEDARQAVKDHISHGVDVIKIVMGDGRLTLPVDEVKSIVETAHRFGIKVTAHATYDKVIAEALDAGVDGIEHGYGIADSLLDRMAKQKVYLVPTIGTYEGVHDLFNYDGKSTEESKKQIKEFVKASEQIVKKAMDKGVMVVNGSDMYIATPKPQGLAAKNSIESYYEACGKANDVLKTATRNAAIACGIDRQTGTLREGLDADIVVFDGDIEKDFLKTLYKIKLVIKAGEIVVRN